MVLKTASLSLYLDALNLFLSVLRVVSVTCSNLKGLRG